MEDGPHNLMGNEPCEADYLNLVVKIILMYLGPSSRLANP